MPILIKTAYRELSETEKAIHKIGYFITSLTESKFRPITAHALNDTSLRSYEVGQVLKPSSYNPWATDVVLCRVNISARLEDGSLMVWSTGFPETYVTDPDWKEKAIVDAAFVPEKPLMTSEQMEEELVSALYKIDPNATVTKNGEFNFTAKIAA